LSERAIPRSLASAKTSGNGPLAALVRSLERAGLEPRAVSSTREHYARTLRAWYRNLQNHWAAAEAEI
jgi:cyclopropane fatty-acyl-phospholipid synthase-like methyltransferase